MTTSTNFLESRKERIKHIGSIYLYITYINLPGYYSGEESNMFLEILKLVLSLMGWGLGYYVINLIVRAVNTIMPIQDTSTSVALLFLWTVLPAVYFFGKVRDLWQQRHILGRGGEGYTGVEAKKRS